MRSNDDRQKPLRYALLGNAMFSTLSGLAFVIGGQAVASFIGVEQVGLIRMLGLGLLGFAACVAFVGKRAEIDLRGAGLIILGDLFWVIGTVPLAALGVLSAPGVVAAVELAGVVLLFAALQYYGVRRIRSVSALA